MASVACVLCVLYAARGSAEPPPAALCKIPYANATRTLARCLLKAAGAGVGKSLSLKQGSSFWASPHPLSRLR